MTRTVFAMVLALVSALKATSVSAQTCGNRSEYVTRTHIGGGLGSCSCVCGAVFRDDRRCSESGYASRRKVVDSYCLHNRPAPRWDCGGRSNPWY
jgi:hypothetical protein